MLDCPISAGHLNWHKVEQQIHAVLNTVDNNFEKLRDSDGNELKVKINDAINVNCKIGDVVYVYCLIKPRFKDLDLWCSGFELGIRTDPKNTHSSVIWKPETKVNF